MAPTQLDAVKTAHRIQGWCPVHAGGEPHLGPPVPRAGVLAEATQASLACVRTPAAAPADGGRGGGRHSCCASESGSGSGLQTRLAFDMRGAEHDGAAAGPGTEATLNGDEEGLEDLLADLRVAPRRAPDWRVRRTLPAAHAAQIHGTFARAGHRTDQNVLPGQRDHGGCCQGQQWRCGRRSGMCEQPQAAPVHALLPPGNVRRAAQVGGCADVRPAPRPCLCFTPRV